MKIKVLTLFPEIFDSLKYGVIGRALSNDVFSFEAVNIRDFSTDKHFKCDDMPFGGGAGMVMTPQPIYDAFQKIDPDRKCRRIYLSPKGRIFNDAIARELAALPQEIIFLCGRYEGVDQRVLDLCIDEEISVGDYVLTGGELAAAVIIDASARFVRGVLGDEESNIDESITSGRLEYPQYTRPAEFMGMKVPEVLLSGHHANVDAWREEQSKRLTREKRPDLLEKKQ